MTQAKFGRICSGYLIKDNKVLLVLHNGFHKWVPPGGHVDADELYHEAAEREFLEETGLEVRAISAAPIIHPADHNSTPLPLPFYSDVMTEGFKIPTVGQYFYVEQTGDHQLVHQQAELDDAAWFTAEELDDLPTFEQVRSLARYALKHHPRQ